MDQIASCIHDELALFVQKHRRVVKDKTKVTRNCQNLPSLSTCVSQDNVFKEMYFLDSYDLREDKSLKGLVKCYQCGGASPFDVECANNHMTESNGREESISAQWSDNDSDDSNNYITSSFEEAKFFALVGSIHNSSLARVHVVKEGKTDSGNQFVSRDDRQDDQSYREQDDQSYKEQDDQSYLGICEKYDVLFTETSKLKERNFLLERKVKNLEILNCTFKEANNELSENVETLKSERDSLIVLKENNLFFQASNKNLLTQINEANDTVIKLTIGAKKVDKMLNMGKVHGDKTAFGYGCSSSCVPPPLTTFVKESNTKFDVLEPTRTQRFIPTCYHCGVKGHIRPRCNALRNVSRATNANDFKNHVSSVKTCELAKSVICTRDKHSSLAKFGFQQPKRFIPICHHCGTLGHIRPKCFELRNFEQKPFVHFKKVNEDSLQTQVNDLLYKVVKIPKVISLPHKVSKLKQVWIKKEDHVLSHVGD
ncbi:unnamed protein product [Prunus brigantina]